MPGSSSTTKTVFCFGKIAGPVAVPRYGPPPIGIINPDNNHSFRNGEPAILESFLSFTYVTQT
jgi:hypothetical protein